jgi:hypothetical protein
MINSIFEEAATSLATCSASSLLIAYGLDGLQGAASVVAGDPVPYTETELTSTNRRQPAATAALAIDSVQAVLI